MKKVLMFAPRFFGYRERIARELEDMDWEVDLYDERPSNSAFGKVMLRYRCGLYKGTVKKYYQSVIAENAGKQYDYVFVIKSEAIDREVFGLLKQAYPGAQFILYLWDSVENVPGGREKITLYDRVLTFDPEDAREFGLIFRPLFFGRDYEQPQPQPAEYTYDVAFVGTAHSARPRIVKQLEQQCARHGGGCFGYLFLPHPIVYLYNKLTNPDYRTVRKSDIHFESMSAEAIREVYRKSRSILDVEHGAQRGLTMRTIEMIGMRKKLITTNAGIKAYDFYDPQNICVIDRAEPEVDEAFWSTDYKPLPEDIFRRYSLRTFVEDIFGIKEN